MFLVKDITVEPRPVDTPPLWTLFSRPVLFSLYNPVQPVHIVSFTTVDTSLLWTPFVRPLAVHISEVLLYYQPSMSHFTTSSPLNIQCHRSFFSKLNCPFTAQLRSEPVADLGGGASTARAPPLPSPIPILQGFSRALKQVLACQNLSSGSKVTGF